MTEVSRNSGGDVGSVLLAENVDDIFVKLSVPEIQQLSHSYKQIISSTKEELHDLVSKKYRDLILIAEDITNINTQAASIDNNLRDLSYKHSLFVSPYDDKYSKFDSILRSRNAKRAQQNSKLTILKILIKNKLGAFMDLQSLKKKPILHTSYLVNYVKIIHSIEFVFEKVLESSKAIELKNQLSLIKSNLQSYIEYEMAAYNVSESILNSSDRFRSGQRTTKAHIYAEDKYLESSGYHEDDMDDGEFETAELENYTNHQAEAEAEAAEVEVEAAEDEEEQNENDVSAAINFDVPGKTSSPICNYLVAYTALVQCSITSMKKKFFDLRLSFLKSLLEKSSPSAGLNWDVNMQTNSNSDLGTTNQGQRSVNYFAVFKFLERTCNYTKLYLDTESSEYHRILETISAPWRASSLLSYREWYEDATMQFDFLQKSYETNSVANIDINCNSVHNDNIAKFLNSIYQMIDTASLPLPLPLPLSLSLDHDMLIHKISNYTCFITALKRLQSSVEFAGDTSHIVEIVSSADMVQRLTTDILSYLTEYTQKHSIVLNDSTSSEKGVLVLVHKYLRSNHQQKHQSAFKTEAVNLMDYDIDAYLKLLTKSNSSEPNQLDATLATVKSWLNGFDDIKDIVSLSKEVSPSIIDNTQKLKQQVFYALPALNRSLLTANISWGSFSALSLQQGMESINKQIISTFEEEVLKFVDHLRDEARNIYKDSKADAGTSAAASEGASASVNHLMFLLGILATLQTSPSVSQTSVLAEAIAETCGMIYQQVIELLTRPHYADIIKFAATSIFETNESQTEAKIKTETEIKPKTETEIETETETKTETEKKTVMPEYVKPVTAQPSMQLESKIFTIAQQLLNAAYPLQECGIELFTEEQHLLDVFISAKDNWLKELKGNIAKAVQQVLESRNTETSSQGANLTRKEGFANKISRSQAMNLLSNAYFVSKLSNKSKLLNSGSSDSEWNIISELCSKEIDEASRELVAKAAESFHKARRNLYLPLSL
ncbi:hypothetical protein PVL30_000835 [Lodderomyces elongisporus]|uniref:uncharacterized protein n=1 Tax=Lodderomyces elongisporus TaxID=36914 RepID=UPI0029241A4C|nr:uncharacterized protein PVL30_000835 [Lodderomyces elongisporus]WLF77126.1 hypothetical protein PVL30_000835 [Lodderomyces elongisporus]